MISPLPPSTHASIPLDNPAPQHPSTFSPLPRLWEGWKSFSRGMGNFQSRILLGLFYFFIVTPFGVAVRIFGDPLHLHIAKGSSNWIPRNDVKLTNLDEAKKQF